MTPIFIKTDHRLINVIKVCHITLKDKGHAGATVYLDGSPRGIALKASEIDTLLIAMHKISRESGAIICMDASGKVGEE